MTPSLKETLSEEDLTIIKFTLEVAMQHLRLLLLAEPADARETIRTAEELLRIAKMLARQCLKD